VGAKVASSLLKKPPIPNLESPGIPDQDGQNSDNKSCMRYIIKALQKLKRCLCRKKKRRRGKGRGGRDGRKNNKNPKNKLEKEEGVPNATVSMSQAISNVVKSKIESSLTAVVDNEYIGMIPINIGSKGASNNSKSPATKDKIPTSDQAKKVPTEEVNSKKEHSRKPPKSKPKAPKNAIYEDIEDQNLEHVEGKKRKVKSSNGDAKATTSKKVKAKKAKTPKKVKVNSDDKDHECLEANPDPPQLPDESEHLYEAIA